MAIDVFGFPAEAFMSEHERTVTVYVSPEEAFRYLSSVSNLPNFVPHLREVREDEEDHVFGIVDFGDGHRSEVSGFFRTDEAALRLDWESDGTPGYRGWLQIVPEGTARSRITVHISMRSAASETPPPDAGLAGERIERTFDAVLRAMQEGLESRNTPARSPR
jgi:uncharacterized membrane protein